MKYIIEPNEYKSIIDILTILGSEVPINSDKNSKYNLDEEIEIKVPIYLWDNQIDIGTLKQLIDLTQLPNIYDHICAMSDFHYGYGMPIGGVLPIKDIIIPYAVGSDIGCSVSACKTSYLFENINSELINKIMKEVENIIPHGVGIGHKNPQEWYRFNEAPEFPTYIKSVLETAKYQLGSLGSGNHFIELLKGDDGYIWLMIHSGSRKLGSQICNEFYHRAKSFCEESKINVPNPQLSYLPIGSDDGFWYLQLMDFACEYAKENHKRMMSVFESIVCGMLKCNIDQEIYISHNFASFETYNNQEVIVHRKGATPAFKNQLGIIPGSMGTNSYIVKGLGNEESFNTVSHGAGRCMGRKEAKKIFKEDETKEILKNIWYNHISLDEDPRCYKDINRVISNQNDLVDPLIKLFPLGVIIGS